MKVKWFIMLVVMILSLLPTIAGAGMMDERSDAKSVILTEFHIGPIRAELDPILKPNIFNLHTGTIEKNVSINWTFYEEHHCIIESIFDVYWEVEVVPACYAPFVIGFLRAKLYGKDGTELDSCYALTFTPRFSTGAYKMVIMELITGDFEVKKNMTITAKTTFDAFLFPSLPPFKTPTIERTLIAHYV